MRINAVKATEDQIKAAMQETAWKMKSAYAMGDEDFYGLFPVASMEIDPEYQRDQDADRTKLMKNFVKYKCEALTCVYHTEEQKLYVVDGLGRITVTQTLDPVRYRSMYCHVILNAPSDPKERQKFEAEIFKDQNKDNLKLRPIDKHGARRIEKDPAVLLLDEMKEKYGFEFSTKAGQQKGGVIGNYQKAYDIAKVNGKECFEFIMYVLRRGGFDRKTNGYSADILASVKDMWKLYPNERKSSWKILGDFLRDKDVLHLRSFTVHKYPMLSRGIAISMYLEDILVEKMSVSHARVIKNGKVIAA